MEDLKDGMCRCCASEGTFKDFTASYQWMGVEEIYSEMLRDCFDITLSTSLLNNGGICELCITQLRNAFNFKKQVQSTEEQFTKMQDRFLKGDIVKKELNQDPMENSDGGDNIDDDFSSPEYDVPIQSIKLEKIDTKTKKRPARATTSKAKKPKVEAGEPSGKRVNVRRKKLADEEADTGVNATRHNIKEILLCTNATPIRSKLGTNFTCYFCQQRYKSTADLKEHGLNDHFGDLVKMDTKQMNDVLKKIVLNNERCVKLDITSLVCKLCDENLNGLDELFQHLLATHNRKLFTDVKNHIIPFKFNTEQLCCCVCFKDFRVFQNLITHMNTHTDNYTCNVCKTTFMTLAKLKRHTTQHHDIGNFKCTFCSKEHDTKFKLYYHERRMHKKLPKTRTCEFCGEVLASRWERLKHYYKIHGVDNPMLKNVTCDQCGRVFLNNASYKLHFRRFHLKEKRFKCDFCEMRFFDTSGLRKHMVKHTKERKFKYEVLIEPESNNTT